MQAGIAKTPQAPNAGDKSGEFFLAPSNIERHALKGTYFLLMMAFLLPIF